MAKSDMLVRWKADTSNYDANIAKARRSLDGFKRDNLSIGGVMKQSASVFVSQAAKFASATAAMGAAIKVTKDAFMASESAIDEWRSTLAVADGVYNSFVQSLNNASFSSFFNNIDNVVQKAREAYNALDELGTRMTIINPERTRLQARATELKATIRRAGATSEAGQAAQAELRSLEPELQKSYRTESRLNMDAFTAEVDKKLAEAGIKLGKTSHDFLMRTFSSDQAFSKLRAGARGGIESTSMTTASGMTIGSTRDTRNINQKLLDLFTDEWREQYSPLLNAAFGAQGSAASAMLSDARYLRSGGTSGGGGRSGGGSGRTFSSSMNLEDLGVQTIATTTSMKELQDQLSRYKEQLATATNQFDYNAAQSGIEQTQKRIDAQPMAVQMGIDVDTAVHLTEQWEELRSQLQEQMNNDALILKADLEANSTGAVKNVEGIAKAATQASKAVSVIGQAFNAIEDPAAKVAATVAQAIASVALAYADTLAKDKTSKWNVFSFIAAAAAATISMATTIAAIHKQTGYALGGVVGGNSYSGDNVGPVMLDAGEVVLNRAQTYALASQLQSNEQGGRSFTTVSGEQLVIAINNYGRRRGTGELISI